MRSSEIIEEAIGPKWLYHGTSFDGALGILEGNEIGSYTEHMSQHLGDKSPERARTINGVSFTRDARFALIHGGDVVFCLDEQKLKARYKAVPLDWMHFHHGEGNPYRRRESEEFVIAQFSIEPLDRYLTEIRVGKQMISSQGDDLSPLLDHPLTRLYDIRTLRPIQ